MEIIERIKDIIFKIKDYDRLENDYCTCLCYFTNSRMSKPNYVLKEVETVITDTINEYMEEGYQQAEKDFMGKACEFLYNYNRNQVLKHGAKATLGCGEYTINVEEFRNYMKGE